MKHKIRNPERARAQACASVLLAALALSSGCGKSGENSAPVPAPVSGSTNATEATEDLSPVLYELTQALRKFSAEKQRVPAALGEVVAAGYIPALPKAPAGKKFAINPGRVEVILADE